MKSTPTSLRGDDDLIRRALQHVGPELFATGELLGGPAVADTGGIQQDEKFGITLAAGEGLLHIQDKPALYFSLGRGCEIEDDDDTRMRGLPGGDKIILITQWYMDQLRLDHAAKALANAS